MFSKMKKAMTFIVVASLSLSGCSFESISDEKDDEELKIGITLYKQEDKFISCLSNSIEGYVGTKENETGKKITVSIVDAKGNCTTQNNQVDKFISQDYDVICVNIIDRTAAAMIVNKAKKADIPVVFFNREPVEQDINMWNKVFYVGAKAEESGNMQAQIILDEYKKNPENVDKNGDGKIQYVMLEGEPEHQDALIRTEAAINTLVNNGIEVDKLGDESANWQSGQAYEKMTRWISEFDDRIEVVFSNNDDMAIGAIHALSDSNVPKEKMPLVVGIDGIPDALKDIKDGKMLGTVFNNYDLQAKYIVDTAYNAKFMKNNDTEKMFKTSYGIITKNNVANYIK